MYDVATTLKMASIALDGAKKLADFNATFDKVELRAKILDQVKALEAATSAISALQSETVAKDDEIRRLRASFAEQGTLVRENQYKYFCDEHGDPDGFPICFNCELQGRLVRLTYGKAAREAQCPACDKTFQHVHCVNAQWNRDYRAQQEAEAAARAAKQGGSVTAPAAKWRRVEP